MFLDDSSLLPDPDVRNTNNNPLINANFRATRQTRHPYDAAAIVSVNNVVGTSALTTDNAIDYESPALVPSVATQASPYVSYANLQSLNGNATQFMILDVPRQSLGLQSLGQLQGAPLVQVPWAPSIPFGNAFMPLQTQAASANLGVQSGYTLSDENMIWGKVSTYPQFNHFIRGTSRRHASGGVVHTT